MPSLPCKNQTLTRAVKKHAKVDIKLFFSCPILLNFSNMFQILCFQMKQLTIFLIKRREVMSIANLASDKTKSEHRTLSCFPSVYF